MTDMNLTRDELRLIISEGVQDAFTRLGIQVDDPIEMQRDFVHLREWRMNMEALRKRSILVVMISLITTALGLVALGFKALFHLE